MAGAWKLDNLYHTVVNVRDLDEFGGVFYELLGFKVLNDRRKGRPGRTSSPPSSG